MREIWIFNGKVLIFERIWLTSYYSFTSVLYEGNFCNVNFFIWNNEIFIYWFNENGFFLRLKKKNFVFEKWREIECRSLITESRSMIFYISCVPKTHVFWILNTFRNETSRKFRSTWPFHYFFCHFLSWNDNICKLKVGGNVFSWRFSNKWGIYNFGRLV